MLSKKFLLFGLGLCCGVAQASEISNIASWDRSFAHEVPATVSQCNESVMGQESTLQKLSTELQTLGENENIRAFLKQMKPTVFDRIHLQTKIIEVVDGVVVSERVVDNGYYPPLGEGEYICDRP